MRLRFWVGAGWGGELCSPPPHRPAPGPCPALPNPQAMAFGGRHSLAVELMLHMLGLEVCADTVVGNQMLRGISGGQKKRVTSGEALVGHAKVLYADEVRAGESWGGREGGSPVVEEGLGLREGGACRAWKGRAWKGWTGYVLWHGL